MEMEQNWKIYCAHCGCKNIFLIGNKIPDNVNYKFDKAQLFLGCDECLGISAVSISHDHTDPTKSNTILQVIPVDKNIVQYDDEIDSYIVKRKLFS